MARTPDGKAPRADRAAIIAIGDGLAAARRVATELSPQAARTFAKALTESAAEMRLLCDSIVPSKTPEKDLLDELAKLITELRGLAPDLGKHASRRACMRLESVMAEIEAARADLDPIKMPAGTFDPAYPDTAGRLVVLALIAQPHAPLAAIARTYGSGVYAIYYRGRHPAYAGISRTETPIYVGKADPASNTAKTPREQGPRLFGRLSDHRKMIRVVEGYAVNCSIDPTIHLSEFTCRKLVCATNAQLVAERHLIEVFKPVWNAETKICWGISKHGDAAETRGNTRSPWDVMHPGRPLFLHEKLPSGTTPEQIARDINNHLVDNPPYHNRAAIIEHIISAFAQEVVTTSAEEQEKEDELAPKEGSAPGDAANGAEDAEYGAAPTKASDSNVK